MVADESTPKVSVIVPVFNAERYLNQCLGSIVAQSLADIEVLCVDDGSTDGSYAILREFEWRYQNVHIISKPNGGYGQAMNVGLSHARGHYIGIVEADDWIEPDMYEVLFEAACASGADVVKADFWLSWDEPWAREVYYHAVPESEAGQVIVPYLQPAVIRRQPAVWSALYKKSFLIDNHLDFAEVPGAAYQDTSFTYRMWTAASHAMMVGQAFVHYRQDNAASSINDSAQANAVVSEMERSFAYLDNFPARKDIMTPVLRAVAYQTFRWNLRRISPEMRPDFVRFMYRYFRLADNAGELRADAFEPGLYPEVMLLLRNPRRYLAFTQSQEERPRIGRLAGRARYVGSSIAIDAAAQMRKRVTPKAGGPRPRRH